MRRREEGNGILGCTDSPPSSGLLSALLLLLPPPPPSPLPSSVRKPPAVLSGNQISHLSSACCAGMSRPHYPAHYAPLLFPNINTISPMPLSVSPFASSSPALSISASLSVSVSASQAPLPPPSQGPRWTIKGPMM